MNKIFENDQITNSKSFEKSDVVLFFLTSKYIESDQFKWEWSKKDDKIFFILLLEDISLSLGVDMNQFFVSNFSNLMESSFEKIEKFLTRITNIKIPPYSSQVLRIDNNQNTFKIFPLERGYDYRTFVIRKMDIINEDEVIVKITNYNYEIAGNVYEEIILFDFKKVKINAKIGNYDTVHQEFCWINHLNQIFCAQNKNKYPEENLNGETPCSLFSKSGSSIQIAYIIKNNAYRVNDVSYNKNNYEVLLNVDDKNRFTKSVLVLDKDFYLIKTIDHILTNPDYPLNFTSEIEILNVLCKVFHLNSAIAFLQEKKLDSKSNDVYIFNKLSYSIIGIIQTNNILLFVSGDKMLFFDDKRLFTDHKYDYLIEKVPIFKSLPDCDAYCKINNPLKKSHVVSNPYLLPCGKLACIDCIYNHYNLFLRLFKCEACNQEHKLPQLLKPIKEELMGEIFREDLYKKLVDDQKNLFSDIGIA